MGAGHPAIDKIVECAQKYGLSSKLTGAGGGGTVIIFNSLKGLIFLFIVYQTFIEIQNNLQKRI